MSNDGSKPRTAGVTILVDLDTQQSEVKLANCATFEFALALVRLGEVMLEAQQRVAQAQQVLGARSDAALTQQILGQLKRGS